MNRSKSLDLLRAVAVLLVLGRHMDVCPKETNLFFHYVTYYLSQGGWIGVDLFFVLSGFLVSGLLFKEYKRYSTVSIKNFLIRRGLKIYPAFYFLILCTILISLKWHVHFTISSCLGELFFLQNYLGALWAHTWSLAIEEHFYLFLV